MGRNLTTSRLDPIEIFCARRGPTEWVSPGQCHDSTPRLLTSELVGLYKNAGASFIGFCRVSHYRSDRHQLPVIIENNRKIL